ncbi:hypothetical protein KBD08_03945 [Candidatus Babeliales bacterium]|nr:hypothetical protein [Candidatus Babeliales bacterium]
MKQHRLLMFTTLLMTLVSYQCFAGEEGALLEDTEESLTKELSESSEFASAKATDGAELDAALKKALSGDRQALESFAKNKQIRLSREFTTKLEVAVTKYKALEAEVAQEEAAVSKRLVASGSAVDANLTKIDFGGVATDSGVDKILKSLDKTAGPVKNMRSLFQSAKTLERQEQVVADAAQHITQTAERYAKIVQEGSRDLRKAARQVDSMVNGLTDSFLETIKDSDLLGDDFENMSAQDIKAKLKENISKASVQNTEAFQKELLKVVKLDAANGLRDIPNITKNAIKDGALDLDEVATGQAKVLDTAMEKIDSMFSDLSVRVKEPGFNVEEYMGKQIEELNASVKDVVDTQVSDVEIAARNIRKSNDIGTVRSMFESNIGSLRSPTRVLSEAKDSLKNAFGDFKAGLNRDTAMEKIVGVAKALKGKAGGVGEMLFSSVIFMVPNVVQSAFISEQQKAALTATKLNPKQFPAGSSGMVWQIPDSCINLASPSESFPVYVQIPVKNVGDTITSSIQKLYPTTSTGQPSISGPSTSNSVASSIHNLSSLLFTFGTTGNTTINRYHMDEGAFIPHSNLAVVYGGPGAYVSTGSISIENSQFTGEMITLNNGGVFNAVGNIVDATGIDVAKGVPLITEANWGTLQIPNSAPVNQGLQSVRQILPSILSKQISSGSVDVYTQYSDFSSGTMGTQLSPLIEKMFDSGCVSESGKVSSDCACVVTQGLQALAGGMTFALDTLGSVAPIFGWGTNDTYSSIITSAMFPNFDPTTTGVTGIEQVGSTQAVTGIAAYNGMEFADSQDLWIAQGCWIYLSTQTPFVQAIKSSRLNQLSVQGPLVDYIVFLGEVDGGTLNVVPLMQPVIEDVKVGNTTLYKKVSMKKNPAVKYWASLLSYNLPGFAQQDPSTGSVQPVMYDFAGKAYFDPSLGSVTAVPGQATGIIPTFLNGTQQSAGISSQFPRIFRQFQIHSAALLDRYNNRPMEYANCTLAPDQQYTITQPAGGTQVPYIGLPCYKSGVADLFVAVTGYQVGATNPVAQISPIQLSNASAVSGEYLLSLVTDIVYQLQSDNSWKAVDFSNSALEDAGTKQETINQDDIKDYVFLEWLYSSSNASSATTITIPQDIKNYITSQRKKWLASMGSAVTIGMVPNTMTCALADSIGDGYAQRSGAYIYQVTPSPSVPFTGTIGLASQVQDYFVCVDTQKPSLDNVKPINVLNAKSDSVLVSLVTGMLFDMQGNPILDTNGLAQRINVGTVADDSSSAIVIFDKITSMFQALPAEFRKNYDSLVTQYDVEQDMIKGPFSFGSMAVVARQGDLSSGVYVYFDAISALKKPYQPRDMYLILEKNSSGSYVPVSYDASQTQFLLSLTTGVLYDQNGVIVVAMPSATLKSMIAQWSVGWGAWIQSSLSRLTSAYQTALQQNTKAQQNLENTLQAMGSKAIEQQGAALKSEIATIIKRLQAQNTNLPTPYSALQYDKVSGNYIHVSPDATNLNNPNSLLYLFLKDGSVYRADGSYVSMYLPYHLQAVRNEYGVVVDEQGNQTLGVPALQPSLLMTDNDYDVAAKNISGQTLISSMDSSFPGGKTLLAQSGYNLYFSKMMGTYYVYDTRKSRFVSIDGGHLYDEFGRTMFSPQRVAIGTKKTGNLQPADDLVLLYNVDGKTQGLMSDGSDYASSDEDGTTMTWTSMSVDNPETYTVETNKAGTTYTIDQQVYKVNAKYSWYAAILAPIDAQGALLTTIPDSSYQNLSIVLRGNKDITHVLYHDTMYAFVSKEKNDYTFKPLLDATQPNIVVKVNLVDPNTNAPYIAVVDGASQYMYAIVPQVLDADQQAMYRATIFKGDTIAIPEGLAVGPLKSVRKTVADKVITLQVPDMTTHNAFVADLPSQTGKIRPLTVVTVDSVKNSPQESQQPAEFTAFANALQSVLKTSETNPRFLMAIAGSSANVSLDKLSFDYVAQDAYVDLQTGALFDAATGISLGYSLTLDDLLTVLDQAKVCVQVVDESVSTVAKPKGAKAGQRVLVYRSISQLKLQAAEIDAEAEQSVPESIAPAKVSKKITASKTTSKPVTQSTPASSAPTTVAPEPTKKTLKVTAKKRVPTDQSTVKSVTA